MKRFGRKFRQGPVRARRMIIDEMQKSPPPPMRSDFSYTGYDEDLLDLSDVMVEQAVGYIGVPLGIAGPIIIDGRKQVIPMASEEPSVIAAASFGGALISRHGTLTTYSADPVMTAQIFLENLGSLGAESVDRVLNAKQDIQNALAGILASMENRGGGWRGIDTRWIAPSKTLAVNLRIDVRDAMGANLLNSAAEEIRPLLEKITGGRVLMAILSNRSWDRTATARMHIPVEALGRPGFDGEETARRIVRAARIAREDPDRAVTHNKGIMNGISALALATGNDTRAIEAAAHAYAGRYGPYHGLSEYWVEDAVLHGSLEMPLPFAVTGGAVGFHPVSRWALKLMGNPDAGGLSRIAAALGLAQNMAALRALVSEGIQQGHMSLHARRLAFDAGARGVDITEYSSFIRSQEIRNRDEAGEKYSSWRKENQ